MHDVLVPQAHRLVVRRKWVRMPHEEVEPQHDEHDEDNPIPDPQAETSVPEGAP